MKHKIIIKYSHVEVHDYDMGDCTKIEYNFRIFDQITHSYYYLGMYYDPEDRILYLPRSMDIYYIEKCFHCESFIDSHCTPVADTGEIKLRNLPRDDVQKEALRFMVGSAEYAQMKNKSQLGLNLSTGKGKTYSSIACISYFEHKSIIVTTSTDWLRQWAEAFVKFSTVKPHEICMIAGSAVANRLISKGGSKYKIFLVTHSTLNSIGTNQGWKTVGKLFEALGIGLLFYDEAHKNFANMSMIDFFTNTYKTYYITATPARSSEEENRIYSYYFKNMPSISLFDEDTDPHTDYVALKFNSNPSPYDISDCRNQYGLDRLRYIDYITQKDEFYKLLRIVMNIVLKTDGKTLFYIGTNNAIYRVYEWLFYNYPELYGEIGIYTSVIPQDQKVFMLNKRLILSTTKSFGEAVDCKVLALTVVLAEPFKSEVLARQTLGRTRDDNTKYIDIVDMGFAQLRKYNYEKRSIMNKYAKSVSDVTIDSADLSRLSSAIIRTRYPEPKPLITMQLITIEGMG